MMAQEFRHMPPTEKTVYIFLTKRLEDIVIGNRNLRLQIDAYGSRATVGSHLLYRAQRRLLG
jgi:hypothetical protein